MTDFTPQQEEALDLARRLIKAGMPVFLARPNPEKKEGFDLPFGWETNEPDLSIVDAWRPGWALCAVTGHTFDVVDIDPRNGGDESLVQLPRVYLTAETPSGGRHHFVSVLGVASRDGVAPGVDVKSGTEDGTGRGFVFIAPTVRTSKADGVARVYGWRGNEFHVPKGDGTGSMLRARVMELRRSSPSADGTPRTVAMSQAQREWEKVTERLARNVRTWFETGRWDRDALRKASMHMARLSPDTAEEAYVAAFHKAGVTPNEADMTLIHSALKKAVPDVVVPDAELSAAEGFFAGADVPLAVAAVTEGVAGSARLSASGNLPSEFWGSRPSLQHIRQAAHAQACSADAVFGVTLALLSAHVPGELRINTGVRSPMPVSTFVALLGNSGTGKSSSAAVASKLIPAELVCRPGSWPLGSGEGLCDAYMESVETLGVDGKKARIYEQRFRNMFFHADEGGRVLDLKQRSGSTLLATLRDAWSGGAFGQRNTVDGGRNRKVENASVGLWVGLQQTHAARLVNDEASGTDGTIQRFLWVAAVDPSVPDAAPAWPGPLSLPLLGGEIVGPQFDTVTVHESIRAELRRSQVARARGDVVAAAGREQDDALRVRLGALLALLDGRTDINPEDWRLAQVVLDTSAALMSSVRTAASKQAIQRGVAREALSDAVAGQMIEKMIVKLVEHLKRYPDGRARSQVFRSVARSRPEEFEAAVQLAEDRGLVKIVTDPQRGDKLHSA